MNLLADLKSILEKHLNTLGVPFSTTAAHAELLLLALNHELKTVSQRPRTVQCSTEFSTKQLNLDADLQEAADAILEKFRKGDDVNGHLSKTSIKAAETDALLADWNIYHLHISNHKDKSGDAFYARTGPVMFAWIAEDHVYFLDIYPHGKGHPETWTRQVLLKIIDDNWPRLLDPFRILVASAVDFSPTDLDLKGFRGDRVNTILQIGNSFIAPPGGGLATDGSATANVRRMQKTIRQIEKLEAWVTKNSSSLKREIASKTHDNEVELDFELVPVAPQGWGVIEKKSRTLVACSSK